MSSLYAIHVSAYVCVYVAAYVCIFLLYVDVFS